MEAISLSLSLVFGSMQAARFFMFDSIVKPNPSPVRQRPTLHTSTGIFKRWCSIRGGVTNLPTRDHIGQR